MSRIRTMAALAVAAGALATMPAAHGAEQLFCRSVGPVSNCTYQDGLCFYGGGRINNTLYTFRTPCPE